MFKSNASKKMVLSVSGKDHFIVNENGDILLEDARIVSPSPLLPSHVATKEYVDATKGYFESVALGLDPRGACRVMADTNIDIMNPPPVIDGVKLLPNDRVLLPSQTDKTQNGIYWLKNNKLVRTPDADQNSDFAKSLHTFITEGTAYSKTGWITISTNVTIGSSIIEFSPFFAPVDLLVGNGLRMNEDTIEVVSEDLNAITVGDNGINLKDLWSDVDPNIESKLWNIVQIDKFGRVTGVSLIDNVSIAGSGGLNPQGTPMITAGVGINYDQDTGVISSSITQYTDTMAADAAPLKSVFGRTGNVTLLPSDITGITGLDLASLIKALDGGEF